MATTDKIRIPVVTEGNITVPGLQQSIQQINRSRVALEGALRQAAAATGINRPVTASYEQQYTDPTGRPNRRVIVATAANLAQERRDIQRQLQQASSDLFDELKAAESSTNAVRSNLSRIKKRELGLEVRRASGQNVDRILDTVRRRRISIEELLGNADLAERDLANRLATELQSLTRMGFATGPVGKKFRGYQRRLVTRGVSRSGKDIEDLIDQNLANQKRRQDALNDLSQETVGDIQVALREAEKAAAHLIRIRRDRFKFELKKVRVFPTGQATIENKAMKDEYDRYETLIGGLETDARQRLRGALNNFNTLLRNLRGQIRAGRAGGLDVSSLEEQRREIAQAAIQYRRNYRRQRQETEAQNRLAAIADLETRQGIDAASRNRRTNERRKNMNSALMAGASAAVGLFGQAGFPVLNVGFAALSGGMMAAGVAAVSTILGEGARAFQRFNDTVLQTADKLGYVTTKFKLINAELEGTRTGFSVIPQMQTQMSTRMQTEFLRKNYEVITGFQRTYESGKIGAKATGYSYLENLFMNPKNLIPGYSFLQYGRVGFAGGSAARGAYSALSPESQLFEAKEMYRKMQQNLLKPLASIETDPFEVWRRIQQAALESGKTEEMRIARETLDAAKKQVDKLQEIVDMGKKKEGLTGGVFPVIDWLW